MRYILLIMISGLLFSCNTSDTPAVTKTPLKEVTLDSLKKLADQYPDSFPLKEDLLWTLRDSNEFSKAIDLAKKYLDKDTVNPKLWHIYADLLAENLDTLPAITAFEKSLSFGKNPDDLIALGQFYASTKNSLALKMALQLLEYKDDQLKATAHVIIGNYSAAINKKDDAIKEFDKSISITFSFMEAYLCKAQVLMDMNKYEEAIKVLENATKIKNSFDEGYYYLGQCYEKIKNKDMAIESYRRALLYSPDYQEAADALQRLSK